MSTTTENKEEKEKKWWWSRTVWGAVFAGIGSVVAAIFTYPIDQTLIDNAADTATAAGQQNWGAFASSIGALLASGFALYGRVKAKKEIK